MPRIVFPAIVAEKEEDKNFKWSATRDALLNKGENLNSKRDARKQLMKGADLGWSRSEKRNAK